ncbi:TRAP transporter large permease subunit [Pusillimonas sp.]|uniref:TRAP transporter large permease subunit n=1 Tax=Pusillimonas sp. TaxID=3040095 RepID=UPI0037C7FBC8
MDILGNLPIYMFVMLAVLMFTGYPVAFVLGGTALTFGMIGYYVDFFAFVEFYNITARIWGSVAEKPILVAIPMFILMGTMLERSGIAVDLLHCLQVLLRRVPGGLAISVTMMGTILAATTGIVGASVIMMTLLALPVMLKRGYQVQLATGTIAASGTLGILIPPSIMLVILADLLAVSVGALFMGALFPGLLLAALYMVYIFILCLFKPRLAPIMAKDEAPASAGALTSLIFRSFLPPVFLIVLVLGSIFVGVATPTEAGGVGAFGAFVLAAFKGNLTLPVMKDVLVRSAKTNAMLFMIFLGATAFSYVFRSLGGDDIIAEFFDKLGIGPVGILVLMMFVVFIMGFFFDWIEIILIILPVFIPILESLDFGGHVSQGEFLVWFAILLAVNLQTSYLTPPFGYALFYMKGAKIPGVTMQHIYAGIVPFVILQLIGLTIVALFPDIVLWLPRMLGL